MSHITERKLLGTPSQPFITLNTKEVTTYSGFSFVKLENLEFLTDIYRNVE